MRSFFAAAAAALLFTASTASAQYPVDTPDTRALNRPVAQPWTLGGYDPRLGYWVHGGLPDAPGDQWAVRAYTPITANGYWLSQPPGTGYVMAAPAAPTAPCTQRRGLFHR